MDARTLRDFVDTDYPRVVAAVTLACGDGALAEDAVQEALAGALDRTDIRNLAAWVTTVASNHARSALRRRGREHRAVLRLPERRQAIGPAEVAEVTTVHRAVSQLPRRQRQAIILRYFLDLDVVEVARELHIAEGTAKALLHQGRRRLARELGDATEPPGHAPGDLAPPPTLPASKEAPR